MNTHAGLLLAPLLITLLAGCDGAGPGPEDPRSSSLTARILELKALSSPEADAQIERLYQEAGHAGEFSQASIAARAGSTILDETAPLTPVFAKSFLIETPDSFIVDTKGTGPRVDPFLIVLRINDAAFQQTGVLDPVRLLRGQVLAWSDDAPGMGLNAHLGFSVPLRNSAPPLRPPVYLPERILLLGFSYSTSSTGNVEVTLSSGATNHPIWQTTTYFGGFRKLVASGTRVEARPATASSDPVVWAFPHLYEMPQAKPGFPPLGSIEIFRNDNSLATTRASLIQDPSFNLTSSYPGVVLMHASSGSAGTGRLIVTAP